jgi:hypothetical protein
MADENKRPLFGGNSDKDENAPETGNAEANANKTTSPEGQPEGKPDASVTDAEAAALQGAGGPNRTPAFVKRDFEDENVQLTDTDDLASAKAGAAAASGSTEDWVGIEAANAAGDVLEGREDEVQYTSTPISKLRIGPFEFKNGVLRVKGDDVDRFEKLLRGAGMRTQQVVRKIDRSAGEAVARRFLEQNAGRRVRNVDTSDAGGQAPRPSA